MRLDFGKLASLSGALGVAALALAGPISPAKADDISIYFVGCAAPTGFHGYLARGAEEAGKNLGVKVTYIYPDQLTIPNQVQKIEEAIAAKASGIAVCAFTEDTAYAEVAQRAKEAGIAFGSAAAPPSGSRCAILTTSSSSAPGPTKAPRAS
jgi:simple sugar transport system substrate-binding protein